MNSTLQKYFSPEAIKLAYLRVQCWPERIVKDQVGMRAFAQNRDSNCQRLSAKLIEGGYKPQRGFKFFVPKASLTNRTKTMLFVEDALVYQAIANQIAADSYGLLHEHDSFVFGSVLVPDTKKGLQIFEEEEPNLFFFKHWKHLFKAFKDSIIHSIEKDKVKYKFETDITGFFDCIPHFNLLNTLSHRFGVEDEILDLLSECLNTWSGTKDSITPGVGIPQGPVPSYLLANMLLHELDEKIISDGFKYYRYMDDIKIYGYEETELIAALVMIDKHLKGNGLSINSKKTTIEPIDEDKEDATVKELRKLKIIDSYGEEVEYEITDTISVDDLFSDSEKKTNKTVKDAKTAWVSEQSEQEQQDVFNFGSKEILTEEAEIIAFWESQLVAVTEALPRLFTNSEAPLPDLILEKDVNDIDFIILSAQYGTSFRKLKALQPDLEPNLDILKFWLYAYTKFLWRADKFGLTLSIYKNNPTLKEFLWNLVNGSFQHYEWAKYMAIQALSLTQTYNDRELRQVFFKKLQAESSDFVKVSLYRLLFLHSNSRQFTVTLSKQLQKESNWYLKVLITDFNRIHKNKEMDFVEFINAIGI